MLKTLTPEEFNSWKQHEETRAILDSLKKYRLMLQERLEAQFSTDQTIEGYALKQARVSGESQILKDIIDLDHATYRSILDAQGAK